MDWNHKDPTEAVENKRWTIQEELYNKGLNDQANHDGVVIHLESDILESEIKCTLESITTNSVSGSDGIPAQLFQIRNLMLLKYTWYVSKFGKLSSG